MPHFELALNIALEQGWREEDSQHKLKACYNLRRHLGLRWDPSRHGATSSWRPPWTRRLACLPPSKSWVWFHTQSSVGLVLLQSGAHACTTHLRAIPQRPEVYCRTWIPPVDSFAPMCVTTLPRTRSLKQQLQVGTVQQRHVRWSTVLAACGCLDS